MAANGQGVSKVNNCNVVKMIVKRGRSRTIKKILSLDMGLPRVESMAKANFAAFRRLIGDPLPVAPHRHVAFHQSGFSVNA